jgi:hypothetical protein
MSKTYREGDVVRVIAGEHAGRRGIVCVTFGSQRVALYTASGGGGTIIDLDPSNLEHADLPPVRDPLDAPIDAPMALDELRRMLAELASTIRLKLGKRSSVIIAAGFPLNGDHDRFASFVTGPCLMSRGLLEWSRRAVESQIDEADTSVDDGGRIKSRSPDKEKLAAIAEILRGYDDARGIDGGVAPLRDAIRRALEEIP